MLYATAENVYSTFTLRIWYEFFAISFIVLYSNKKVGLAIFDPYAENILKCNRIELIII